MYESPAYSLYLDDQRDPETDRTWVVVRSYEEFVETIEERGMPRHISFDHDLGENQPDGMDCVWWLIDQGYVPDSYNIHSGNPVGAENIEGLLSNWIEHNQGR